MICMMNKSISVSVFWNREHVCLEHTPEVGMLAWARWILSGFAITCFAMCLSAHYCRESYELTNSGILLGVL